MSNASLAAVDAVAKRITAAHLATRNEKKAKPTPEAWRKIWHDELRKHYPAFVMTYSDAVATNLKRAVKHRGLPVEDVGKLLAWIVGNWTFIRRKVFSRNPRYLGGPETPDMKVVISYLPQIHGLFNSSKPEFALTAFKPGTATHSAEPVAAPSAPPPQNNAPAGFVMRRKPLQIKPIAIDHAAAERARQRLNLPKWRGDDGQA